MSIINIDPTLTQVVQRRLEVICNEAAITLNRTSGSPIVTEANDFATAIMSLDGEVLAFSSYLSPHFVSATNAIRELLGSTDIDTINEGDTYAGNDPVTIQPLHPADVSVITPIFVKGELAAWAYTSVHVLDIGGLTGGGWIPGAYDRFGEGFTFPLTKIVSEHEWNESFRQLYLMNVRTAESFNDLRSCVAANNTAVARFRELVGKYDLDTINEYASLNLRLSEDSARKRIATLPNGIYTGHDWVDYDGHGDEWVLPLSVSLTVRDDELLIDLTDSPPQVNCFMNTTRAARLGWVFGELVRGLYADLPINSGLLRPVRVLTSQPGTLLNPGPHAATSAGHMEAGTKVMRAFHGALHRAIGLSSTPEIRSRVAGLGANVAPHNVVSATMDDGTPSMWVSFDSLGTGLGAQLTGDGRDCGCYEDMTGSRMLDTELEELSPDIHFYRRLCVNSGGHGFRRGGLGVDSAWMLYGVQSAEVTVFSNNTRVPSRSPGGGYPGGGTGNHVFRAAGVDGVAEISERVRSGDLPNHELWASHGTNLALSGNDVVRSFGAGGSGLGDPLFRETWRVKADLENAVITPDVAASVYGVSILPSGDVDEGATESLRRAHRTARLGAEPRVDPDPMTEYRPSLLLDEDVIRCNHCRVELSDVAENWKLKAHARFAPLIERSRELGAMVRPTEAAEFVMCEFFCPSCATLLEVDIAVSGEERPHDIQVGAVNTQPGEPF